MVVLLVLLADACEPSKVVLVFIDKEEQGEQIGRRWPTGLFVCFISNKIVTLVYRTT
jgi:hypothetical protein